MQTFESGNKKQETISSKAPAGPARKTAPESLEEKRRHLEKEKSPKDQEKLRQKSEREK